MRIINFLSKLCGQLFGWFFLLSVLITGYEVVMRYLFNAPTLWGFETSLALSASAIIMSGSYVAQKRDHIAITTLLDICSPKSKKYLRVFVSLFSGVVCLCIAWAGYQFGYTALADWETSGSGWDAPIPALVKPLISLSALLMGLQIFCNTIEDFHGVEEEET